MWGGSLSASPPQGDLDSSGSQLVLLTLVICWRLLVGSQLWGNVVFLLFLGFPSFVIAGDPGSITVHISQKRVM